MWQMTFAGRNIVINLSYKEPVIILFNLIFLGKRSILVEYYNIGIIISTGSSEKRKKLTDKGEISHYFNVFYEC